METGVVVVQKVCGETTVTRCFSQYPLKFIVPNKVGPSKTDAVWIYTLTYGGGIVCGDSIFCKFDIEDGCNAVLTTQASTKVYKSVGSKCCHQIFEVKVGSNALLVLIPDPVTCFSTARYSQSQTFRILSDSNLVVVDWFTSGRYESGEKWDFDLYKSSNNIFMEDDRPLLLDTLLLEKGSVMALSERMHDYQVVAMVILLGPKLKDIQSQIQENVKKMMFESLHRSPATAYGCSRKIGSDIGLRKPKFIASCSAFGPKGVGLIIRVVATTTEAVYQFLNCQLSALEPIIGVAPYAHYTR